MLHDLLAKGFSLSTLSVVEFLQDSDFLYRIQWFVSELILLGFVLATMGNTSVVAGYTHV